MHDKNEWEATLAGAHAHYSDTYFLNLSCIWTWHLLGLTAVNGGTDSISTRSGSSTASTAEYRDRMFAAFLNRQPVTIEEYDRRQRMSNHYLNHRMMGPLGGNKRGHQGGGKGHGGLNYSHSKKMRLRRKRQFFQENQGDWNSTGGGRRVRGQGGVEDTCNTSEDLSSHGERGAETSSLYDGGLNWVTPAPKRVSSMYSSTPNIKMSLEHAPFIPKLSLATPNLAFDLAEDDREAEDVMLRLPNERQAGRSGVVDSIDYFYTCTQPLLDLPEEPRNPPPSLSSGSDKSNCTKPSHHPERLSPNQCTNLRALSLSNYLNMKRKSKSGGSGTSVSSDQQYLRQHDDLVSIENEVSGSSKLLRATGTKLKRQRSCFTSSNSGKNNDTLKRLHTTYNSMPATMTMFGGGTSTSSHNTNNDSKDTTAAGDMSLIWGSTSSSRGILLEYVSADCLQFQIVYYVKESICNSAKKL